MKIKSVILCFIVLPLMACECSMEPISDLIKILNKSEFTISCHLTMGNVEHCWEGNAYPDTTLTFGRNCVEYPIKPNGWTDEYFCHVLNLNALNNCLSKISRWDLIVNSCVGHTTRALWRAGIPTLYAFHPHLLNAQLFVRQLGVSLSPFVCQMP